MGDEVREASLNVQQQVDLLHLRGMSGDSKMMFDRLGSVSYYRLSAYWHPFHEQDPADPALHLDTFKPGTSFEAVWSRYVFDRRLRLIVMDAVERFEIAVRSSLAQHHALEHGPFAYALDAASMPGCKWPEWVDFIAGVKREAERSKETFVKHFKTKYGDAHSCLPIWMAIEIMTFGSVLTLYRGCSQSIKQKVAQPFAIHDTVFDSWLLSLNTVRNICAHHGRLWNREMGTKPKIPAKDPAWNLPIAVPNERVFGILTLCKWSLDRVAPQSGWAGRVRALHAEFPAIPLPSMGFPSNWQLCPIWLAKTP